MEHALALHRPALIVVFAIVVVGALFYVVTSRRRSRVGNGGHEAIDREADGSDARAGASSRAPDASDRSPAA